MKVCVIQPPYSTDFTAYLIDEAHSLAEVPFVKDGVVLEKHQVLLLKKDRRI